MMAIPHLRFSGVTHTQWRSKNPKVVAANTKMLERFALAVPDMTQSVRASGMAWACAA